MYNCIRERLDTVAVPPIVEDRVNIVSEFLAHVRGLAHRPEVLVRWDAGLLPRVDDTGAPATARVLFGFVDGRAAFPIVSGPWVLAACSGCIRDHRASAVSQRYGSRFKRSLYESWLLALGSERRV